MNNDKDAQEDGIGKSAAEKRLAHVRVAEKEKKERTRARNTDAALRHRCETKLRACNVLDCVSRFRRLLCARARVCVCFSFRSQNHFVFHQYQTGEEDENSGDEGPSSGSPGRSFARADSRAASLIVVVDRRRRRAQSRRRRRPSVAPVRERIGARVR